MLVMVVFFIAFRWIHLSTPLIRLFLLVLILLLMPTLNFLPVWFALSLLRFRLPSRQIGRAVQQECRDRPRMPSSALKKKRFLHRAGYSVVLIDFQATGETKGDHITFGWKASRDL